jgi:hypothetical protein
LTNKVHGVVAGNQPTDVGMCGFCDIHGVPELDSRTISHLKGDQ